VGFAPLALGPVPGELHVFLSLRIGVRGRHLDPRSEPSKLERILGVQDVAVSPEGQDGGGRDSPRSGSLGITGRGVRGARQICEMRSGDVPGY